MTMCRQSFLPLLVAFSLSVEVVRAELPATMPSDSELAAMIRNLGDDDAMVRDNAEVIIMAHPFALPQFEEKLAEGKLSPGAEARLKHCVDLLRPGYEARLRLRKEDELVEAHRQQEGPDSYLSIGDHNPKWDADALEAIRAAIHLTIGTDPQNDAHILDECQKAISAGCNDPLVRYFLAHVKSVLPGADQNADAMITETRAAASAMMGSKYCARFRADAALDAVGTKWRLAGKDSLLNSEIDHQLMDKALALLPEITQQEIVPRRVFQSVKAMQSQYELIFGDTKKAFDMIYPVFSQAVPNGAGPLIYKGDFYIQYAWEARGSGFANTVTDAGAKLFVERLAVAREALEAAYKLDPDDSRAATDMLIIVKSQSLPRADMELWFDRAMHADPDNNDACMAKMDYLQPKWNGSLDELMQFAHECVQTENWYGNLPLILVETHKEYGAYAKPAGYFKNPQVWADAKRLSLACLLVHPDDNYHRSLYAFMACKCGHLVVANKLFKTLGDQVVVSVFRDKDNLNLWKSKAAARAAGQAGQN